MPSSFAWTYVCAASLFFTQNKKQQNDKKTSRFPSSWVWNKQGRRSLANTALLSNSKKKTKHNNSNRKKNKTFKKLLDLASVIPSTSNIHIIHTCEQNSCWLGAVVMETISS